MNINIKKWLSFSVTLLSSLTFFCTLITHWIYTLSVKLPPSDLFEKNLNLVFKPSTSFSPKSIKTCCIVFFPFKSPVFASFCVFFLFNGTQLQYLEGCLTFNCFLYLFACCCLCKHRVLLLKNKMTFTLWKSFLSKSFKVSCHSCVNNYAFFLGLYWVVFKSPPCYSFVSEKAIKKTDFRISCSKKLLFSFGP